MSYRSIVEAVAHHATIIPNKTAIIEGETGRTCTYGELWAYVKVFSEYLSKAGVAHDFGDGYGTRVVARCAQSIDFVITSLAIQLAGGVFVPVEKRIADTRIKEIMEETDSTVLVAAKPLTDYACTYIPLSDASVVHNNIDDVNTLFPDPNALAVILYTTGTTGKSKGVMHSTKSSVARVISYYSAFLHDDQQIWLNPSPLCHINGLNKTYLSLFYKCTVVLVDGYALAEAFFSSISKYKVTIINLMSAAAEIYLRTCRDKLIEISEQIKYICLPASSFTEGQILSLRDIFSNSTIIQTYGATEVSGCYINHTKENRGSFCLGKPREGTDVAFFNEQKTANINADSKNPGLIAMNSETKMRGYWKNPVLTASVTRGEYIILSDLGYKGEDGLLYFISRADDVITSGGYKIAPLEIEEIANMFDGIRESACIAIRDPILGEVPKLYVLMNEGYSFDFSQIYKHMTDKLEATRVPRYIEEIDEIPKINSKINRRELRDI